MKKISFIYFQISEKIQRHAVFFMCISIAIVFIWFGALKIFGISPADDLVEKTIFWFKPSVFIPILGYCEVLIGLGLLIKRLIPYVIVLLLLHLLATFLPIVLLRARCFSVFPFCPTLVGQYIIKNIVFIAGGFVIIGKHNHEYYAAMDLKKEQEKSKFTININQNQ